MYVLQNVLFFIQVVFKRGDCSPNSGDNGALLTWLAHLDSPLRVGVNLSGMPRVRVRVRFVAQQCVRQIRGSTLLQKPVEPRFTSTYGGCTSAPWRDRGHAMGATSPQHQGNCHADNVTMVHISAKNEEFYNSTANQLHWMISNSVSIAKGQNESFVSIWKVDCSTDRN